MQRCAANPPGCLDTSMRCCSIYDNWAATVTDQPPLPQPPAAIAANNDPPWCCRVAYQCGAKAPLCSPGNAPNETHGDDDTEKLNKLVIICISVAAAIFLILAVSFVLYRRFWKKKDRANVTIRERAEAERRRREEEGRAYRTGQDVELEGAAVAPSTTGTRPASRSEATGPVASGAGSRRSPPTSGGVASLGGSTSPAGSANAKNNAAAAAGGTGSPRVAPAAGPAAAAGSGRPRSASSAAVAAGSAAHTAAVTSVMAGGVVASDKHEDSDHETDFASPSPGGAATPAPGGRTGGRGQGIPPALVFPASYGSPTPRASDAGGGEGLGGSESGASTGAGGRLEDSPATLSPQSAVRGAPPALPTGPVSMSLLTRKESHRIASERMKELRSP